MTESNGRHFKAPQTPAAADGGQGSAYGSAGQGAAQGAGSQGAGSHAAPAQGAGSHAAPAQGAGTQGTASHAAPAQGVQPVRPIGSHARPASTDRTAAQGGGGSWAGTQGTAQAGARSAAPSHWAEPAAQNQAGSGAARHYAGTPAGTGAPAARHAAGSAGGTRQPGAQDPYGAQRPADAAAGSAARPKLDVVGIFSTALIVVGIALLIGAGVVVIRALWGYREAAGVYDEIETVAVVENEGVDYPSIDFEALAAINEDIVGWIYIPGTEINYPVVQTDDNSTYLTKLFDGTGNGSGTIFMDYEGTAPGMVDQQTTLYGHHMSNGSMFNIIDKSLDQDVFDTIEVVYYITADATYVLKPLCTTEVDADYTNARTGTFSSDVVFRTYLRTMVSNASAVADDATDRISDSEQVLSLITCAGEILPRTTRAVMICTVEEVIYAE